MAVLLQQCPQALVSRRLAWPGCLGNRRDQGQRSGPSERLTAHVCPLPCSIRHSSLTSEVQRGKLRWDMPEANQQDSSLAGPGTLSSEVAGAA